MHLDLNICTDGKPIRQANKNEKAHLGPSGNGETLFHHCVGGKRNPFLITHTLQSSLAAASAATAKKDQALGQIACLTRLPSTTTENHMFSTCLQTLTAQLTSSAPCWDSSGWSGCSSSSTMSAGGSSANGSSSSPSPSSKPCETSGLLGWLSVPLAPEAWSGDASSERVPAAFKRRSKSARSKPASRLKRNPSDLKCNATNQCNKSLLQSKGNNFFDLIHRVSLQQMLASNVANAFAHLFGVDLATDLGWLKPI